MSLDPTNTTPPWLASHRPFDHFVHAWTTCTLPKAEWTHSAHIAIAANFILLDPDSALDTRRSGIRRYIESIGGHNTPTSGYHETLTHFWVIVVARVLHPETQPPWSLDPWLAATLAVRTLGHQRDLYKLYYSWDVVASTPARLAWHPPDLVGPYGPIH